MSQPQLITLYDLPCRGRCACWSPNVWKTRLVLNYKSLPYTSEFVAHPDIAPQLEALGLPPTPPTGKPGPPPSAYTLPAIRAADGSCFMDSAVIATELEKRYPEPSLHLEASLHEAAQGVISRIAFPLLPVFMPAIARNMIREADLEYWVAKREKLFGMPLDEFEKTKGGEAAWQAAEPGMAALKEFLAANKRDAGPFILGSQVSYGDFIIAAMLESMRRLGEGIFERSVRYDASIGQLHAACKPWFEKDE